jgi:hypothetical protein
MLTLLQLPALSSFETVLSAAQGVHPLGWHRQPLGQLYHCNLQPYEIVVFWHRWCLEVLPGPVYRRHQRSGEGS